MVAVLYDSSSIFEDKKTVGKVLRTTTGGVKMKAENPDSKAVQEVQRGAL
jgi:hypothetical protein